MDQDMLRSTTRGNCSIPGGDGFDQPPALGLPGAISVASLPLVVRPGAPSSVLAPSSEARSP